MKPQALKKRDGRILETVASPVIDREDMREKSASVRASKQVMLIASGGGHWIELTRIAGAFADCDCEFVSTAPGLAAPVGGRPVIRIQDSSRDSVFGLVRTFFQIFRIVRSHRPDIVVSTGAAPGAIALFIAKFYGIRTIWIDSIANCEELSLSGHAVKHVADLRLTQWPELADRMSKLQYFGRVL